MALCTLRSDMLESYIPKRFCREFVEVKRNSLQLTMIMATVKEIKPCMDDWIALGKYDEYRKICKRYGLFIKPDLVFNITHGNQIPVDVIGREKLTTTKAFGSLFNKFAKNGAVHVFISKSKDKLERCFREGMYPLIIKNRVIDKPLIDYLRFGYQLGYPNCCIEFFRKYNDWYKYSHLYEIFKNTPVDNYNFLVNPLLKDMTYSYVYHMPCSYSCGETIKLAEKLREAIREEEAEFVKIIDRHLKSPFLIFYEKKIYLFEGEIKDNKLIYKNVHFTSNMQEYNLYESILRKGNSVFIDGKYVVISKKGRLIKKIACRKRNFAPETPFIIQFH